MNIQLDFIKMEPFSIMYIVLSVTSQKHRSCYEVNSTDAITKIYACAIYS